MPGDLEFRHINGGVIPGGNQRGDGHDLFCLAEMGSDERDYNNRLSTLTQASARADVLQTVVTELVTDQLRADLEAVHDSVNEGVTAGMSQLADRILDQVFGLE